MNNKEFMATKEEEKHLEKTLDFIDGQLCKEHDELDQKERELVSSRREMYENTAHHSQDFNKLTELIQYLNPLKMQTMDFQAVQRRIALYKRVRQSPYFARVDFFSEEFGSEVIYIGIGNIEDEETFEAYAYDWRAPISSLYYQYELGKASYTAPVGIIEGEINLKRQIEITDGNLDYFFDSSVNITDEILKETLSKNSSDKMRIIVETIQREQDTIIRDTSSDLLIVQGVAGSGKTSIALHRAAYLMYEGLNGRLDANNMILISPNNFFAQYISNVLPDLGEKNIETVTFERLFLKYYGDNTDFSRRWEMLEEILTAEPKQRRLLEDGLIFKSSRGFLEILNRLIDYYQRSLVNFEDVMYAGKIVAKKELLKARLLESSTKSLQIQVRLGHIEKIVGDAIGKARPARLRKLEDYYAGKPERALDFKTAARLASTKESSRIMHRVKKITRIDYVGLYSLLFSDKNLFNRLSKDIELPENIEEIMELSWEELKGDRLGYSDSMAIFLLKLRMDSARTNLDIRQVVVDEAQDYSPVHFEILGKLYPSAKYTVLGDINQTITKLDDDGIYQSVIEVLAKKNSTTVQLSKSFRCSYEISKFASQFTEKDMDIQQLDRHENKPEIIGVNSIEALDEGIARQIEQWQSEGYERIAVICKNGKYAEEFYRRVVNRLPIRLFLGEETAQIGGAAILPVYLAKGLEFDGVIIYDPNDKVYREDEDRRVLYIACTRALHRLALIYNGKLSPLIKGAKELELDQREKDLGA